MSDTALTSKYTIKTSTHPIKYATRVKRDVISEWYELALEQTKLYFTRMKNAPLMIDNTVSSSKLSSEYVEHSAWKQICYNLALTTYNKYKNDKKAKEEAVIKSISIMLDNRVFKRLPQTEMFENFIRVTGPIKINGKYGKALIPVKTTRQSSSLKRKSTLKDGIVSISKHKDKDSFYLHQYYMQEVRPSLCYNKEKLKKRDESLPKITLGLRVLNNGGIVIVKQDVIKKRFYEKKQRTKEYKDEILDVLRYRSSSSTLDIKMKKEMHVLKYMYSKKAEDATETAKYSKMSSKDKHNRFLEVLKEYSRVYREVIMSTLNNDRAQIDAIYLQSTVSSTSTKRHIMFYDIFEKELQDICSKLTINLRLVDDSDSFVCPVCGTDDVEHLEDHKLLCNKCSSIRYIEVLDDVLEFVYQFDDARKLIRLMYAETGVEADYKPYMHKQIIDEYDEELNDTSYLFK